MHKKENISFSKLKKKDFVEAFAQIFINEKTFQKFFSRLQDDVKKILNILVWEGGEYNTDTFKKMFDSNILIFPGSKPYRSYKANVQPPYLLFQINEKYSYTVYPEYPYTYYLYLNKGMQNLFKKFMAPPDDYNLNPIKEIEKTEFLFQDNGQIVNEILLFYNYIEQGNINFSKKGDKILVSSIRQMKKYCRIHEFYDVPDKDINELRTKMIIDILMNINKEEYNEPIELLKKLADELVSEKAKTKYKLRELLFHLNGLHYFTEGYNAQVNEKNEQKVRNAFFEMLKEMSVHEWVSAENIAKYCIYRDDDFNVINRQLLYLLSFNIKTKDSYERVIIDSENYNKALLVPFVKAFMFLCAGLGFVDIAYDYPENKLFQEKDKNYLSLFDGLKYVKLTKLGAYLFGISDEYDVKIEYNPANIILDEDRLIINIDRYDPFKSMVMEKIADKITDNCYIVNYNSFLKECRTKKDIRQKIRLFREQISPEPPYIWKNFINDIMKKMNPLTADPSLLVFKLAQNDELISLLAKDEILKKYILKAEDYHIVINSKNIGRVKLRLEEFGYFIDNI